MPAVVFSLLGKDFGIRAAYVIRLKGLRSNGLTAQQFFPANSRHGFASGIRHQLGRQTFGEHRFGDCTVGCYKRVEVPIHQFLTRDEPFSGRTTLLRKVVFTDVHFTPTRIERRDDTPATRRTLRNRIKKRHLDYWDPEYFGERFHGGQADAKSSKGPWTGSHRECSEVFLAKALTLKQCGDLWHKLRGEGTAFKLYYLEDLEPSRRRLTVRCSGQRDAPQLSRSVDGKKDHA